MWRNGETERVCESTGLLKCKISHCSTYNIFGVVPEVIVLQVKCPVCVYRESESLLRVFYVSNEKLMG